MKISVALCTYNGERFLKQQLQSIAAQERQPDELVICDDCSADNTVRIAERFASTAPFLVKVYRNAQNFGSTKNFEKAIRLCDGDVIALSDQDDVWRRDKLSIMEHTFSERQNVGLVFADAEVVDAELRLNGYRLWEAISFTPNEQKQVAAGHPSRVLLKHNVVTGAVMAFRSAFKDLILPIPESWVHDGWIALLISFIADLAPISQPLIMYRQHGSNQIGAKKVSLSSRVFRRNDQRGFRLRQQQLEDVLARIEDSCTVDVRSRAREMLRSAISHYSVRATLCGRRRVRRVGTVVQELINLNYFRYSSGLLSAIKDFLW